MSDSKPASLPPSAAPADLARVTSTLRTAYHCVTLLTPSDGPTSLLPLLLHRFPHIPEESWPERFDFGGVYVNGREALGDQPLPFPCKVEYYEPKFPISEAHALFPKFEERFVIYQDDAVAVVYKPPRLSSMPAKEQRHFSLKASLEKLFKKPVHMPSRLDVSAQGLLVVSLHPDAHAKLQQCFESRKAHKTYFLATTAPVAWERVSVDLPIARDPRHPVLRTTALGGLEGQPALTHLTRSHLAKSEGSSVTVVKAEPVSGRTHQIRVHAASQAAPIFGDNFYGGDSASYLHLVSCSLAIPHPASGHALHVELPHELCPGWINR